MTSSQHPLRPAALGSTRAEANTQAISRLPQVRRSQIRLFARGPLHPAANRCAAPFCNATRRWRRHRRKRELSDTGGSDDSLYDHIAPVLREKVGRLLNDKMPTGVAVSPAMNHGGPFPATGHPGFTAVGIPASLRRFAMLQCFDQVRPERLPEILRDQPPNDRVVRFVDGEWRRGPVAAA